MDERSRKIKLIHGYLPRIDSLPRNLHFKGFTQRFAIVMNTYYPDRATTVGMYFDWEFFLELLKGILSCFSWDSLLIKIGKDKFSSLERIQQIYQGWNNSKDQPDVMEEILVSQKTSVVCQMKTEFYTEVGGPEPYHDSLTFSFYFTQADRDCLRQNCIAVCKRMRASLEAEIEGGESPLIPLWQKAWIFWNQKPILLSFYLIFFFFILALIFSFIGRPR